MPRSNADQKAAGAAKKKRRRPPPTPSVMARQEQVNAVQEETQQLLNNAFDDGTYKYKFRFEEGSLGSFKPLTTVVIGIPFQEKRSSASRKVSIMKQRYVQIEFFQYSCPMYLYEFKAEPSNLTISLYPPPSSPRISGTGMRLVVDCRILGEETLLFNVEDKTRSESSAGRDICRDGKGFSSSTVVSHLNSVNRFQPVKISNLNSHCKY